MRRQADHVGLNLSVWELVSELSGIAETVLLYHGGGPAPAHNELLRGRVRRMAGRAEEPTAAIVDSQTVKNGTYETRPSRDTSLPL